MQNTINIIKSWELFDKFVSVNGFFPPSFSALINVWLRHNADNSGFVVQTPHPSPVQCCLTSLQLR